jgi:hypothetical protein
MGLSSADPLLDLIDRYDVSHLEFGLIRLTNTGAEVPVNGYGLCRIVAFVDANYLASTLNDGRVLFLDGCHPGFVMLQVASNGGQFLDALIEMNRALNQRDASPAIAQRCAEKAGGAGALRFFESIL